MPSLDYKRTRELIDVPSVLRLVAWEPKKRYGNEWRGYCPLPEHVSTRKGRGSFAIEVQSGKWKCFKCDGHGGIFDLWRIMANQPIHEAVLSLCKSLGIEPVYKRARGNMSNLPAFAKFARNGRPDPRRCDHTFVEDEHGNLVCEGCGKAAGVSVAQIDGGDEASDTSLPVSAEQHAAEANRQHQLAFGKAAEALDHARQAGESLTAAKRIVPHGDWGRWVEDHCEFSPRTAQGYMRVAERWEQLAEHAGALSLRGALALLEAPKKREKNATVADLSRNRVASKPDGGNGRPIVSPPSPAPTAEHEPETDSPAENDMVRSGTQEKWRTRLELVRETLRALDRLLSEAGRVQRQMKAMDLLDSDAKAALDQVYAGRESLRRILAREAAKAKREET